MKKNKQYMNKINKLSKNLMCDSFIRVLQNGYEFKVGFQGDKLSGGQKQRLAIFRAMIKKNIRVLVSDEGFAALDNYSRKNIISYILDYCSCKNITFIAVMHRLDFIAKMDCIVLMKKGTIVDCGNYDELYKRSVTFRNML